MNELNKMFETESDENVRREIKYALYLYKDLLTNDNKDLLDDYTNTIIEIFFKKAAFSNAKRKFDNNILERFYNYLIRTRKTEKTAYDYVKRVERICKEFNIKVEDLFYRSSSFSINDLIGIYSRGGVKSDENIKKHNAPLSALKQFRDFMNGSSEDDYERVTEVESPASSFYLCQSEGYQSFEILSKHPYTIEIKDRTCKIVYKENRCVCDVVTKEINDKNYEELISVFKKYKDILSQDKSPVHMKFPFGGVNSYSYQFEDKSNFSCCASLFESDDRELKEKAYAEYHAVLDKIIKQ